LECNLYFIGNMEKKGNREPMYKTILKLLELVQANNHGGHVNFEEICRKLKYLLSGMSICEVIKTLKILNIRGWIKNHAVQLFDFFLELLGDDEREPASEQTQTESNVQKGNPVAQNSLFGCHNHDEDVTNKMQFSGPQARHSLLMHCGFIRMYDL